MQEIHKKLRDERGMTLIESIIAITIMVTAITGPMMLAYQSLRATRDARNQLIATHLASEGIEIVLSIRSNNSAKNVPWDNGLNYCVYGSTPCVLNLLNLKEYNPLSPDNAPIQYDCATAECLARSELYFKNGIYLQPHLVLPGGVSVWEKSPFRRIISIQSLSPNISRVTSTVYFRRFNGTEGTVVVIDDMYNWFPELI